jgi:hypothetical protein
MMKKSSSVSNHHLRGVPAMSHTSCFTDTSEVIAALEHMSSDVLSDLFAPATLKEMGEDIYHSLHARTEGDPIPWHLLKFYARISRALQSINGESLPFVKLCVSEGGLDFLFEEK